MTASLDPTFIPAHAVTCWSDDRHIYVAMPTLSGGQPYITKYPLNEGGLSKTLSVLKTRYDELPTASKNYTITPNPIVKTVKGYAFKSNEADRTSALAILRKMRIV
jgi:hypothetical protein